MTMHQCPKCELIFAWQTELDDHCHADHPQFHHDYPVRGEHHNADDSGSCAGAPQATPRVAQDRG